MGSLKELNDRSKNVHLLLTSSNLAEIYVYDVLKKRCDATLESILEVNNSNSFKDMLELVNVQPNLAEYWFFVIDYSKVKSLIKKTMGIFQSNTSVFLLKVKNYKDFVDAKNNGIVVNDLYLNTIKKTDVMDLLRSYNLSAKVKDFVATSYYKDPEKVFTLCKELDNGADIEKPKDVIKLCGESISSIQKFIITLLTDAPKTSMYFKRSYKNRVATVCSLCDTFGTRTAYNYIKSSIKDVLDIKVLYMEGIIYDKIRDLPVCYDEAKLSRYNYFLSTITKNISYEKIIHLRSKISESRWYSDQDAIKFLYDYYIDLLKDWKDVAV